MSLSLPVGHSLLDQQIDNTLAKEVSKTLIPIVIHEYLCLYPKIIKP